MLKTNEMQLPEKWLPKPITLLKTAFVKRYNSALAENEAPLVAATLSILTPDGDKIAEDEAISTVLARDSDVVFQARA